VVIENSIVMGSDYYEKECKMADQSISPTIPLGIGEFSGFIPCLW
jgi:hypothetical protein